MKKLVAFILVLFPFVVLSQTGKVVVSAGVGNLGQIDKTLTDFYYPSHETFALDESEDAESHAIRYHGALKVALGGKFALRIKYAKTKRHDEYSWKDGNEHYDYSFNQKISSLGLAGIHGMRMGKFELATGVELPLYLVRDFHAVIDYSVAGPPSQAAKINSKMTMDGGTVWGVNHLIDITYLLSERVGVGMEMAYGLLFANLGEKIYYRDSYILPRGPIVSTSDPKKLKKSYFSGPEFSVNLQFRIGGFKAAKSPAG